MGIRSPPKSGNNSLREAAIILCVAYKRFGDYFIDMKTLPENIEMIKNARLF